MSADPHHGLSQRQKRPMHYHGWQVHFRLVLLEQQGLLVLMVTVYSKVLI